MKKLFSIVLIAIAGMNLSSFAQTWNAQQAEVLKNVEAYWVAYAKGDVADFLSYFSDDYVGWSTNSPVPENKQVSSKYISYSLPERKTLFHHITPLNIIITGDVAIIHYYYSMHTEDSKGEKKWASGRWTDILKKQGTKWALIADHGGEEDED